MSMKFNINKGDQLLKAADIRITKPRQIIAHILVEACDHPDAEMVWARARAHDNLISQATTYRTLAILVEKGLLITHTFDGSATRYELAERPHHDHMIDIETGEVKEFVSREIERLQAHIAAEHGYEIVAHRLELYCRKLD